MGFGRWVLDIIYFMLRIASGTFLELLETGAGGGNGATSYSRDEIGLVFPGTYPSGLA